MKRLIKLSLPYAFFYIQGCTSLESTPNEEFEAFLNSKVESNISEVIQNWGQPKREIVSSKKYDKKYWIFETNQTSGGKNHLEYAGVNYCKVVLLIDKSDSIKYWVTEGDGCIAPSEFINLDW